MNTLLMQINPNFDKSTQINPNFDKFLRNTTLPGHKKMRKTLAQANPLSWVPSVSPPSSFVN